MVRKWSENCQKMVRKWNSQKMGSLNEQSCIAMSPPLLVCSPCLMLDWPHPHRPGWSLSPSNGRVYLLTCIDRFIWWPEAVPIADGSANTVACACFQTWVSWFGVHTFLAITKDRGRVQPVESFRRAACDQTYPRTTSYPPYHRKWDGRKWFRRKLKSSLTVSPHAECWMDMLHWGSAPLTRRIRAVRQLSSSVALHLPPLLSFISFHCVHTSTELASMYIEIVY